MPHVHDITVCLVGFEQHKARPDLSDDSGFWLRVSVVDSVPFIDAFRASPTTFHEFLIEQRVAKQTRISNLSAQIVEVEEEPAEVRILLRPHPLYGAVAMMPLGH